MSDTQTVSQIRQGIDQAQAQLSQTAQQIETQVKGLQDWRVVIKRYPLACLGVAVGAGVVLAGSGRPLVRYGTQYAKTALLSAISGFILQQVSKR